MIPLDNASRSHDVCLSHEVFMARQEDQFGQRSLQGMLKNSVVQ